MGEEKATIEEQLKAGNTVISFTRGTSMHPLLYEGKTYVVISPITGGLSVGDMPLWRRGDGKYVLHRLVKIDGSFCYTRGDNCIGAEKVPMQDMLGVVTEIVRGGKTIHVTDKRYRRYVALWMWLTPVRIPLYQLRAKLGQLRHKARMRLERK